MLTLSSKQMNKLRESRYETAVASVARFMREIQPAGSLDLPEARLAVLARLWVDKAVTWGILSVPLICELFGFRARWGSFDDPESSWILGLLEGPMTERDKLDYLAKVLYAE